MTKEEAGELFMTKSKLLSSVYRTTAMDYPLLGDQLTPGLLI